MIEVTAKNFRLYFTTDDDFIVELINLVNRCDRRDRHDILSAHAEEIAASLTPYRWESLSCSDGVPVSSGSGVCPHENDVASLIWWSKSPVRVMESGS